MAVEVDALQLNIGADSTSAAQEIDSLKNSLSGLLQEVKNASALGTLQKQLAGTGKAAATARQRVTASLAPGERYLDKDTGYSWTKQQLEQMQYVVDVRRRMAEYSKEFKERGFDKLPAEQALKRRSEMKSPIVSLEERKRVEEYENSFRADAKAQDIVKAQNEVAAAKEQAAAAAKEVAQAKQAAEKATKELAAAEKEQAKAEALLEKQAKQARYDSKKQAAFGAADNFVKNTSQMDIYSSKRDAAKNKLAEAVASGDEGKVATYTNEIKRLDSSIQKLKDGEKDAAKTTKEHKSALQALRDAAHNASSHGIGKLVKSFTRMLRMRAIRSAVRGLISSFKEGYQSLYGWSKYMGGDFASGIDSAKNSLATMKNSLATAIAPVIQAALPYVQQLIQWIRSASDYVSQFFAILQGKSTWTRAKDVTADQMEKINKNAKGAKESVQEMLASFDELNVIQSENNGSGSGNTNNYASYKDLYEEVSTFDSGVVEWANKIKPILQWVGDHFKEILVTVGALKLGLGLLNFSSGFTSGLSSLKWLAGIGTISVGAVLGFEFGKDIGNSISTGKALSAESIGKGVAGAIAAAIGGTLLFGPHGWAIGLGVYVVTTLAGLLTNEDVLDKLGIRKKLDPFDEKKPNNILSNTEADTSGSKKFVDTVKNGTLSGGAQTVRGYYDSDGNWHFKENFIKGLNETQTLFKNEITKWHAYLEKAGIDTQTIMDNWDLIAPDINPDDLSKSAEHIVDLINRYGDNWLDKLDWLRDTSISGLKASAKKFTSTGKEIPKALAKGLASDEEYKKSLQGMLEVTELGVFRTKEIVNNADLVAPVIQTFGYENSIDAMKKLAITSGLNTKTILEHWNLIAPRVKDKDMEQSLKDVNNLITIYGDKWVDHLSELDLKAEVDVKEKTGWFAELKDRISSMLKNNPIAQAIVNVANNAASSSGSSWNPFGGSGSNSSSGGLIDLGGSTSSSSGSTARDELLALSTGTMRNTPFSAFNLKTDKGKDNSRRIETWNLTDEEVQWLKDNGYKYPSSAYLHEKTKRGIRQVRQLASGGTVPAGQLFLAREKGAEYVGSMGGSSGAAVANNQQIVQGISQGVENANRTQNDLLREQNSLLRALLRKDTGLKPSAALGRILAQSEAMYDGVVGV